MWYMTTCTIKHRNHHQHGSHVSVNSNFLLSSLTPSVGACLSLEPRRSNTRSAVAQEGFGGAWPKWCERSDDQLAPTGEYFSPHIVVSLFRVLVVDLVKLLRPCRLSKKATMVIMHGRRQPELPQAHMACLDQAWLWGIGSSGDRQGPTPRGGPTAKITYAVLNLVAIIFKFTNGYEACACAMLFSFELNVCKQLPI